MYVSNLSRSSSSRRALSPSAAALWSTVSPCESTWGKGLEGIQGKRRKRREERRRGAGTNSNKGIHQVSLECNTSNVLLCCTPPLSWGQNARWCYCYDYPLARGGSVAAGSRSFSCGEKNAKKQTRNVGARASARSRVLLQAASYAATFC